MGVGNLQAAAANSAQWGRDLAAQRDLHSAVKRPACGKEHGVASHQRIDSRKSGSIVGRRRTSIRRQAKHGSWQASEILPTRIQSVARKVGDGGPGHSREITIHRGLGTCTGAGGRKTPGAQRIRRQGGVYGVQRRILIQMASVSDVIGVVSNQVVGADVANIVHAEHGRRPHLFLEPDVHLNRARSLVIRRQHALLAA